MELQIQTESKETVKFVNCEIFQILWNHVHDVSELMTWCLIWLQVYDFVVVRNGQRLITGSADSELRVWDIEYMDSLVCPHFS
jgi:WD40 repeat protein